MTPERRKVLDLLGEASERYPDMRIGQLLTWFASAAREPTAEAVYNAEDNELIATIDGHLRKQPPEAIVRAG